MTEPNKLKVSFEEIYWNPQFLCVKIKIQLIRLRKQFVLKNRSCLDVWFWICYLVGKKKKRKEKEIILCSCSTKRKKIGKSTRSANTILFIFSLFCPFSSLSWRHYHVRSKKKSQKEIYRFQPWVRALFDSS